MPMTITGDVSPLLSIDELYELAAPLFGRVGRENVLDPSEDVPNTYSLEVPWHGVLHIYHH